MMTICSTVCCRILSWDTVFGNFINVSPYPAQEHREYAPLYPARFGLGLESWSTQTLVLQPVATGRPRSVHRFARRTHHTDAPLPCEHQTKNTYILSHNSLSHWSHSDRDMTSFYKTTLSQNHVSLVRTDTRLDQRLNTRLPGSTGARNGVCLNTVLCFFLFHLGGMWLHSHTKTRNKHVKLCLNFYIYSEIATATQR